MDMATPTVANCTEQQLLPQKFIECRNFRDLIFFFLSIAFQFQFSQLFYGVYFIAVNDKICQQLWLLINEVCSGSRDHKAHKPAAMSSAIHIFKRYPRPSIHHMGSISLALWISEFNWSLF